MAETVVPQVVLELTDSDAGLPTRRNRRQNHGKRFCVSPTYVAQHDDCYLVADTRVSLDSIVYGFLSGQSAESLAQAFPLLTLEQVYGAIAFYLGNRDEVDRYLDARRQGFNAARDAARDADPMFYQKLADAKKHIPIVR